MLSAQPTTNKEPHYRGNARTSVSHLQNVPKVAAEGANTEEANLCGRSAYADQHACEHDRPDPKKPYAVTFKDVDLSLMQMNGWGMPLTSA